MTYQRKKPKDRPQLQELIGRMVHNIDDPMIGGQLVEYIGQCGRVVDMLGESHLIPQWNLKIGSPRRGQIPLDTSMIPGLEEDVFLVNCAGCQIELVGRRTHPSVAAVVKQIPPLAGRIDGRPYCQACLDRLIQRRRLAESVQIRW